MSTRFCPTETKGRVHFYCRKKKEAAERMDTMFTFKCELMEKGCPAMKWDSAVTVTRRNGKMVEAIVDGMNDIFRIIMGVYSDGYLYKTADRFLQTIKVLCVSDPIKPTADSSSLWLELKTRYYGISF